MFKHHLSYVYMKNPVGFPNGMMKTQFKRIGLDLLAFNEAGDALQSLAKQFYEDFQRAQGCQAMPAGGGKDTLQRRELAARPPLHSKPLLSHIPAPYSELPSLANFYNVVTENAQMVV